MKPRDWTPEEDARLLALQADGHSAEGILERLPVHDARPYTRHQVVKRCRELGVKPAGRRYGPGSRFTRQQIARMQTLFAGGATLKALAAEFGCGPETIRQMAVARILVRDLNSERVDIDALRTQRQERAHPKSPVYHAAVPDAPSSELWRLWERAESSVRGVAA